MARSIHVRLDDEADDALATLRRQPGVANDSDAVRRALTETARRARSRSALRQEAAAIAADPVEQEELRLLREFMDDLAVW